MERHFIVSLLYVIKGKENDKNEKNSKKRNSMDDIYIYNSDIYTSSD